MSEGRAEARAPDDRIKRLLAAFGPYDPALGETLERPGAVEDAPLARLLDRGHHHHVPEAPERRRLPILSSGLVALGGPLEEHAAIHVVGQEARLLERRPGRVRYAGDLGEYLGRGVPAAHDEDLLPRVAVGRTVERRMNLDPAEVF